MTNMNANNYQKPSRQQLVDLFKKEYDVRVDKSISYKHAEKVDVVIKTKKGKNIYVIFKGKDAMPVMFADVVNLDYVRLMDVKNGKRGNQYIVFCEKKNNPMAEGAAEDAKIPYYKNFNILVKNIKKSLSV